MNGQLARGVMRAVLAVPLIGASLDLFLLAGAGTEGGILWIGQDGLGKVSAHTSVARGVLGVF